MGKSSQSKTEYTPQRFKNPPEELKSNLPETKYYFGAMLFILSLFMCITILLMVLPRPRESVTENRALEPFPQFSVAGYLDGSYAKNLTKWFSDTVPYRDTIVGMSGRISELFGLRYDNVKFHGNVNIVATESVNSETLPLQTMPPVLPGLVNSITEEIVSQTTAAAEQTLPANTASGSPEFNNNGIVTVGDRSFMLFGGSRSQGKYYADVINAYKTAMGDDVNVYSMVIPTAVEFYLPEAYSEYSNSEKHQIDYIYENLSGVTPVDAYSKLAANVDKPIYLKTDHHWAQLGAYYASTAFAETLGETPQSIDDYEKVVREGYVGSLYGYTNDIKIKENPEQFVYYRQPLPYKTYFYDYDTLSSRGEGQLIYEAAAVDNSYAMFIGMDAIHTKIVTENKNGKRLCVFKDSFGNALIPELIPYFEEIYVIDFRFFGMSAVDYMKSKEITDVLFVNNIFAANTGSLIDGLNTMRTGPYGLH
jgi:hypothetical protein